MFPPSARNSDALRQALQSSLQDVLNDVSFDTLPNNGMPSLGHDSQGLFDSVLSVPGAQAGFTRSSIPPIPSFLRGPMMNFTSSPESVQASMTFPQSDSSLLNHARAQLLKQQMIAEERKRQLLIEEQKKYFLQDSYMALLQAGVAKAKQPAMNLSSPMSLNMLLGAQAPSPSLQIQRVLPLAQPSYVSPQLTAQPEPKHAPNALEALGSSLRNKNDPYIDVSSLKDPDPKDTSVRRTRGGVSTPFPEKLHEMLIEVEKEGKSDIVSFFSHGRAFGVHDHDRFVSEIMPKYFKQSKWNSFARQLNLYGFIRITSGPDAGGYYHELFLKGRPNMCFHMRRVGVPQGSDRRKQKTKQEAPDPDFYSMKPLTQLPESV